MHISEDLEVSGPNAFGEFTLECDDGDNSIWITLSPEDRDKLIEALLGLEPKESE